METVLNKSTLMELWYEMVMEAQQQCGVYLSPDLESYLVFLLIRFTTDKTVAQRVLGCEYLESLMQSQFQHKSTLKELGDHALLLSGLFPQRAKKRRVDIGYYIGIGRSAYSTLAEINTSQKHLYHDLSFYFNYLVDIIHALRPSSQMSVLDWLDLWQHTRSKRALSQLHESFDSRIVLNEDTSGLNH